MKLQIHYYLKLIIISILIELLKNKWEKAIKIGINDKNCNFFKFKEKNSII